MFCAKKKKMHPRRIPKKMDWKKKKNYDYHLVIIILIAIVFNLK